MLNDAIVLNDGVAARTYTLVSRNGMDSTRRETTAGTPSSAASSLSVKHQIDLKKPNKANRHLVSITYSETDAAGNIQPITVHAVITRAKGATDAQVLKQAEMIAKFLDDPANVSTLLIGGN